MLVTFVYLPATVLWFPSCVNAFHSWTNPLLRMCHTCHVIDDRFLDEFYHRCWVHSHHARNHAMAHDVVWLQGPPHRVLLREKSCRVRSVPRCSVSCASMHAAAGEGRKSGVTDFVLLFILKLNQLTVHVFNAMSPTHRWPTLSPPVLEFVFGSSVSKPTADRFVHAVLLQAKAARQYASVNGVRDNSAYA